MNIVNSNLTFNGQFDFSNTPDCIIIHHAEASICTVEDVHRWHLQRGWIGIGYQYFIKKDGTIYIGRPEKAVGAHTISFNAHSIGICCEGSYMTETMQEVQKQALIDLCKDISKRYPINHIYGHKEVNSTNCPGNNFPLLEVKNKILEKETSEIKPVYTSPNKSWLEVGDKGSKVAYLQKCLISIGFDCGTSGADGDYGKLTKNAVYRFQNAIKIQADGLAGDETFKAIEEILKMPLDGVKYPHYEYATRFIQYKVNAPVDGLFGTLTAEYVKEFQKKNKLTADGVVGPQTWGRLL